MSHTDAISPPPISQSAAFAVPGFFYQNSGWYQFGFRFSLDYTPHLILLLSIGRRPLSFSRRSTQSNSALSPE